MRRIEPCGTHPRAIAALALAVLLLPLAGCQRAYFAAVNAGASTASRSVAYGPHAGQRLDVYRPTPTAAPAPVVLFLYGGRWQSGKRADYAFVGDALARAGMLALVADYRRYPQVRFPTFVEDAALALRWARQQARASGGDPARIFLAGHSAGAHLAAMLATDARFLAAVGMQPRDLAGVIGIAGPYDFLPLTERDLQDIFGPRERWADTQPVNFVDGDEPRFLLLHGTDDRLVWPRNSERLAARLREAGGEVEHRVYPDLGHIRILSGLRYPALADTLADIRRFVDATQAPPPAAASGAR